MTFTHARSSAVSPDHPDDLDSGDGSDGWGGVDRPGSRPRLTAAERAALRDQLRTDYDAGASVRELAAATGWSYAGVHHLLTGARTAFRARGTHGPAIRGDH